MFLTNRTIHELDLDVCALFAEFNCILNQVKQNFRVDLPIGEHVLWNVIEATDDYVELFFLNC